MKDDRAANGDPKFLTPGSLYGVPTPSGEYKNWVKEGGEWNTLTIKFTPPTLRKESCSR